MNLIEQAKMAALSGLVAYSKQMEITSNNIANANTTGTKDNKAFARNMLLLMPNPSGVGVMIGGVQKDNKPLNRTFDPNHPSADKMGFVTQSNVQPNIEMADHNNANMLFNLCAKVYELSNDAEHKLLELLS